MKLKAVFLRAGVNVSPEVVEVENFNDVKQLIEGDSIITATRFFGKERFSIFFNSNAEQEGKAISSLFTYSNKPLLDDLFGNLIVVGYPSLENNLIGLSDEDIKTVLRHVVAIKVRKKQSYGFLF